MLAAAASMQVHGLHGVSYLQACCQSILTYLPATDRHFTVISFAITEQQLRVRVECIVRCHRHSCRYVWPAPLLQARILEVGSWVVHADMCSHGLLTTDV
jgi:hypothetical protein